MAILEASIEGNSSVNLSALVSALRAPIADFPRCRMQEGQFAVGARHLPCRPALPAREVSERLRPWPANGWELVGDINEKLF